MQQNFTPNCETKVLHLFSRNITKLCNKHNCPTLCHATGFQFPTAALKETESDFSVTQTNVRTLTYSTWLTDSEYSKLLHEFLRVPFGDDPRTLPLDTRKRIWRLFFRAYKDSQIQDDLVVWNTYAEHNQNPLCALFFAGYCSMYPYHTV